MLLPLGTTNGKMKLGAQEVKVLLFTKIGRITFIYRNNLHGDLQSLLHFMGPDSK